MKVYLAASFSRQAEMKQLSLKLIEMGLEVTSRWLEEKEAKRPEDRTKHNRENAIQDVNDVRAADIVVRFTDEDVQWGDSYFVRDKLIRAHFATGGRMFECGLAWAEGKPIIVIGGHQNIFDCLPNIIHLPDAEELKRYLSLKG